MSAVETRHGIGVSPGTAVGPVVQVRPPVRPPAQEPAATDPAGSGQLVRQVLESVASTLDDRAARADATAKEILTATAMMARDPGLAAAADKHLASGRGPATAVDAAAEEYCALFAAAGGYLAERVTDLRDVRDRAVARLLGLEDPGVPELNEPCVIVAHDLAPAETVSLRRDMVLAIVTESGGPTSHTAILAAQMGIPAVVQVPRAVAIEVGTVLAVDGSTGEVFVDPDPSTRIELVQRSERRAKALGTTSGPGVTSDGHPVALLANIGTAADAERAGALDVEGVGLFRTEFLFLDRDTAPSLEEQVAVYTRVFEAFGSRRVVVRTLDAGADKPLAFADLGPEENPALGRRGLRLSAERPELLDTQLTALASAARDTGADVRVMAPMVATAEEAAWFA
ncbi:MAG TPA: putative PEP-binding protein, partial [Dermatophilaceae bacterium]